MPTLPVERKIGIDHDVPRQVGNSKSYYKANIESTGTLLMTKLWVVFPHISGLNSLFLMTTYLCFSFLLHTIYSKSYK